MISRYGFGKTLTFLVFGLAGAILGGIATVIVFFFTWENIAALSRGNISLAHIIGVLISALCALGLACSTLILITLIYRFIKGRLVEEG
jgi:hypothetical protein